MKKIIASLVLAGSLMVFNYAQANPVMTNDIYIKKLQDQIVYFKKEINRLLDLLAQKNKQKETFPSNYIFTYTAGEKPWLKNIDNTKINTTFQDLLKDDDYYRGIQCKGDSTDVAPQYMWPCLQGYGVKMYVSRSLIDQTGVHFYSSVFSSPAKGGLFGDRDGKIFFIVPFNGYEIKTFDPIQTAKYLPIWKEAFLKKNSIDKDYFNSHIFVVSVTNNDNSDWELPKGRITITYYYNVDWAYIRLTDTFDYNKASTADEILKYADGRILATEPNVRVNLINNIPNIDHIATKKQIADSVKKISPILGFDINQDLVLYNGELSISLHGDINQKENKCLGGAINLSNAIAKVRETACYIIN